MPLADDLATMGTVELARRLRKGELSATEVVQATAARIEERNPSLNALVHQAFDEAIDSAREADDALHRGESIGPLHGVPTALKDITGYKPGWPATWGGIRALKDNRPNLTGLFTERMERAGAIIVGQTNSPTMGFRGTCDNYLFGPTRNPFNLNRNSGGSSGGSAAAVADGLLTFAEATDGGGSIRIPASWCGAYGFKASVGRVPHIARPNAFSGLNPYIHLGSVTRSVADTALTMDVLAGSDPRDPLPAHDSVDFTAATKGSIRGLRIAYSSNFDVFPVDPRVETAVAKAVAAFEESGATVEAVNLGLTIPQQELSDLWCRLIMPNSLFDLDQFKADGLDLLKDHADDFPPEYRRWVEIGRQQTVTDFLRDQAKRTEVFDAVQRVFDRHDLLVTPTVACLPVENARDGNTVGPSEINDESVDPLLGWCLTYPINFTGHPAASIPAGLADGLPVGMQIIGRLGADANVIAASAEFERLRPWQDSYEICANRPI